MVAVGVLLLGSQSALAATSHQFAAYGAGEAWYNAGDHDLAHGPNSFIIKEHQCDRFSMFVQYSWQKGSDHIPAFCGEVSDVSIAPLGPNRYPLRWRTCGYDLRNILRVRCGPYIDDFVYTS